MSPPRVGQQLGSERAQGERREVLGGLHAGAGRAGQGQQEAVRVCGVAVGSREGLRAGEACWAGGRRGRKPTPEGRAGGGHGGHGEGAKHRKEARPAGALPKLSAGSLAGGIRENSLPKPGGCLS